MIRHLVHGVLSINIIVAPRGTNQGQGYCTRPHANIQLETLLQVYLSLRADALHKCRKLTRQSEKEAVDNNRNTFLNRLAECTIFRYLRLLGLCVV